MTIFDANLLRLARAVLDEAREASLHIACAESCTGGLIAACLTELDGASSVVERGFVVYSNQAKHDLLGVPASLIEQFGAVSEEVARAMAEGAIARSGVDLALSCTGIAGPAGGTRAKPVGLVHFAAARRNGMTLHQVCRFGDIGRGAVRLKSVEAGLRLLRQAI